MSILDIFLGRAMLVTGIKDDPKGGLRVYIGPRYEGNFFIVEDDASIKQVRQKWGSGTGHLLISRDQMPLDAVFNGASDNED